MDRVQGSLATVREIKLSQYILLLSCKNLQFKGFSCLVEGLHAPLEAEECL